MTVGCLRRNLGVTRDGLGKNAGRHPPCVFILFVFLLNRAFSFCRHIDPIGRRVAGSNAGELSHLPPRPRDAPPGARSTPFAIRRGHPLPPAMAIRTVCVRVPNTEKHTSTVTPSAATSHPPPLVARNLDGLQPRPSTGRSLAPHWRHSTSPPRGVALLHHVPHSDAHATCRHRPISVVSGVD